MIPALALALILAAPAASAPERSPQVLVELDPCVELDTSALEVQLALEFGPPIELEVRPLDEASPKPSARPESSSALVVTCNADRLTLTLDDGLTGKTMTRELELAPGGGEWERRALALAVVEFVRASWLELELRDEPKPPDAPRPPTPEPGTEAPPAVRRVAKQHATRPPRPWLMSFGPRMELIASELVLAGGGQLRVVHQPRRILAWTLAAGAVHARPNRGPGRLAVTEGWLAPALLAVLQRPRFSLAGGSGLRLGLAHMRGLPSAGASFAGQGFTRSFGGAFALTRAQLELPTQHRLALAFELELGWAFRPVTALAGDEVVFALQGGWVAAGVELAFGL